MRGVIFVKILTVVIILSELTESSPECDMETDILLDEGNMGHTSDFGWLGLLQVFLNDGDATHVAVTGLVLVKADRALASADDIVRIPMRTLRRDARAVFITDGEVAVNYSVISYVTHPEYEVDTFNSMAVVLLDVNDYPLVPICFPKLLFDADHLYLTGFTDENAELQKTIYRIQYTDRPECEAFYEKEGLKEKSRQPVSYFCGKGWSTTTRCLWDNGMALVSNSSGWFTLVGFSIHGPGCSAPSRFLSILHYAAWIRDVTRTASEEMADQDYVNPDVRRTDGWDTEFVPIHRSFTKLGNRYPWPPGTSLRRKHTKWPFAQNTLEHWVVQPSLEEKGVIQIRVFDDMFEQNPGDCGPNVNYGVMYKEEFKVAVKPDRNGGTVIYRLSMYDMTKYNLTCVKILMDCGPNKDCDDRSKTYLAFKEVFEMPGGDAQTPDEVMQVVPIIDIFENYRGMTTPRPKLRPEITEGHAAHKDINYDLWIKFVFKTKGYLNIQMIGSKSNKTDDYRSSRRFLKKKAKLPRRKKMGPWWTSTFDEKVVKEALVGNQEVVWETVGGAPREASPGMLLGCVIFLACLRILVSRC